MTSKKKVVKKVVKKVAKKPVSKLVKKINRKIAKDNLEFQKLSPSQKRIQIARDVLAQLASKKLVAQPGVWLSQAGESSFLSEKVALTKKDVEVQTVLSGLKKCEGCALGGMFMCAVERADKLKVSDLSGFSDVQDNYADLSVEGSDAFGYLKKFFSESQLNLIECAFEQGNGNSYDGRSENFVYNIDDPSERMRLIMENIIANNGTFNYKKKPVYTWVTPGFKG